MYCWVGICVTHHGLENLIDHTDLEMHMSVQAGAEAVNETHCAERAKCFCVAW